MDNTAGDVEEALPVGISKRHYLSTHHLFAARYAAIDAAQRESGLAGTTPIDLRHRGLVLTAVSESVAFLEAAINEVFQDVVDGHPAFVEELADLHGEKFKMIWDMSGGGWSLKIMDKYDYAFRCADVPPFDHGQQPYQEGHLLVRLRNYLLHYKPHDVVFGVQGINLGVALEERKFSPNALTVDTTDPWFPSKALGAGCADWSWRAARALTDEFARRLDLRLNYQVADYGDSLPS